MNEKQNEKQNDDRPQDGPHAPTTFAATRAGVGIFAERITADVRDINQAAAVLDGVLAVSSMERKRLARVLFALAGNPHPDDAATDPALAPALERHPLHVHSAEQLNAEITGALVDPGGVDRLRDNMKARAAAEVDADVASVAEHDGKPAG